MVYLSSSHAERYSQWASNSAGCFLELSLRLTSSTSERLHDVPHLVVGVAGIQNLDFVDHRALDHFPVGALDEAVLVDARETGERRDEADVGAFRRFNGADAAVVRGVNVAHFKSGALAAQASRTERRETPLVGDLGERVGLVHELGKLARPEELADGRHHRLGVHQVVRHGRGHLLVDRHLLLDGALHAHQADAELVLEQLAHGAHAPVAEVIDVVHVVTRPRHGGEPAQLQQVLDGVAEVVLVQGAPVHGALALADRVGRATKRARNRRSRAA